MSEVTRILSAIEQGDPHAPEQLLPLVYDELRKLAAAKLAQEKGNGNVEGSIADQLSKGARLCCSRPGCETGNRPHSRRAGALRKRAAVDHCVLAWDQSGGVSIGQVDAGSRLVDAGTFLWTRRPVATSPMEWAAVS